jgi:hypothetical protein
MTSPAKKNQNNLLSKNDANTEQLDILLIINKMQEFDREDIMGEVCSITEHDCLEIQSERILLGEICFLQNMFNN